MNNSLVTDILGIPKLLPVSLRPQKTKISTILIYKAYKKYIASENIVQKYLKYIPSFLNSLSIHFTNIPKDGVVGTRSKDHKSVTRSKCVNRVFFIHMPLL